MAIETHNLNLAHPTQRAPRFPTFLLFLAPLVFSRTLKLSLLIFFLSTIGFAQQASVVSTHSATDGRSTDLSRPSDDRVLIDPNELVLQALKQSVWGPGFSCKMRQKTKLFDREVNSIGRCIQAGHGTGKLKVNMKLTIGNEVQSTEQACDGRVLWTSLGLQQPFRTVNLDSIRTAIAKRQKWDPKQPELAICLAIGGQSEVLRTLYIKYRWYKAFQGTLDGLNGLPVWQLVGTVRTQPPPVFPVVVSDRSLFDLKQEPFPTEVRLTLARDASERLFPLRIEYYQRTKETDNGIEELLPFSTIEYFELQTPIQDVDGLFDIKLQENFAGREDEFLDREDETEFYMPKG